MSQVRLAWAVCQGCTYWNKPDERTGWAKMGMVTQLAGRTEALISASDSRLRLGEKTKEGQRQKSLPAFQHLPHGMWKSVWGSSRSITLSQPLGAHLLLEWGNVGTGLKGVTWTDAVVNITHTQYR